MFIAVEGINGSGKDTLINKLKGFALHNPNKLVYSGYSLRCLRVFTAKPLEEELTKIKGYNYSSLTDEERITAADEICNVFITNYVRCKRGRNTKDEKLPYTYEIEMVNRWNLSNLIYGLITGFGNKLTEKLKSYNDISKALDDQDVKDFINRRLEDYVTNRFLLPNKIIYVSTDPEIAYNRVTSRNDGRTSSSYHMKDEIVLSSYLYDEFINKLSDEDFAYKFITPLELYTGWGDSQASKLFTFNGNLEEDSPEYKEQLDYLLDFLRR